VLVVSSAGLAGSTVQLHYAVNAPASQSAASQVLDEFMGEWSVQHHLQDCNMSNTPHVHGITAAAMLQSLCTGGCAGQSCCALKLAVQLVHVTA
jgi:hypothetical protein